MLCPSSIAFDVGKVTCRRIGNLAECVLTKVASPEAVLGLLDSGRIRSLPKTPDSVQVDKCKRVVGAQLTTCVTVKQTTW
jgi:hypothetical protein